MRRRRGNIHTSWLIMWLSLATVGGIALAGSEPVHLTGPWLVVGLALIFVGLLRRNGAGVVFIVAAGLLLGIWRGGLEQSGMQTYAMFYGHKVTITGTVSEDASYGTRGDVQIILQQVSIGSTSAPGKIWVSLAGENAIRRSDRVTVIGALKPGFGSLAGSMFRANITSLKRPQPGDIGLRLRDWFAGGVRTAIPEPEASLASGYLVGQRSSLPADLDAQLKTVGLTHAVVASGYNLTILVSIARQLLLGVSKYLATLSAGSMIGLFIAMSGLSPSMMRAGLVTSLSLAAWYYGRTFHPFVLLPLAAAVTALVNPTYVWGDIGWSLSFASFGGVIILAPLIRRTFWPHQDKQPNFVMQIIVDTLSAQIATLPIMVFAFGHYSPYALLANVLVLPLIPITMLLTFVGGIVGLVVPDLAHFAGWPVYLILHYMTTIVARIAELPGAQGNITISLAVAFLAYALLAIIIVGLWRRTRYNFHTELEQADGTMNYI